MTALHASDGLTASREPTEKMMFRRKATDGTCTYVHFMDLSKTTTNRDHAWIGTQRQALTVRARYEHARSIPLVRVQHKGKP